MKLMPQEVEVRYILPALRSELARRLAQRGLKQTAIADMLHITPSAVSQYLKAKRGTTRLKSELEREVQLSVERIVSGDVDVQAEVYRLTQLAKDKAVICAIHHQHDDLPRGCDICFRE